MNLRTWTRYQRSRLASWACLGLGGLALFVGWLGVARATYPAQQLPYLISGGLGGLCLVGVGALLWLSSDLEDEWTKLDLIEDVLRELARQEETGGESPSVDGNGHAGVVGASTARGRRRAPLTSSSARSDGAS